MLRIGENMAPITASIAKRFSFHSALKTPYPNANAKSNSYINAADAAASCLIDQLRHHQRNLERNSKYRDLLSKEGEVPRKWFSLSSQEGLEVSHY
jgi:hypothetical protein